MNKKQDGLLSEKVILCLIFQTHWKKQEMTCSQNPKTNHL